MMSVRAPQAFLPATLGDQGGAAAHGQQGGVAQHVENGAAGEVVAIGEGIQVELVEEERLSGTPRDLSRPARYRAIVNCGKAARGMKVEVRGESGKAYLVGDENLTFTQYFQRNARTRLGVGDDA